MCSIDDWNGEPFFAQTPEPPVDDGPVLTDEEQMALVTAVRVQQVARIITRDTGAPEDAAMTAAWSLARVGLLATPWRGDSGGERG